MVSSNLIWFQGFFSRLVLVKVAILLLYNVFFIFIFVCFQKFPLILADLQPPSARKAASKRVNDAAEYLLYKIFTFVVCFVVPYQSPEAYFFEVS